MLPNFLVIGAPKAASTSLCGMLRHHPQIFFSDPKEVNFFSKDYIYRRGLPWYEGFFRGAEGYPAVGEGGPSYSQLAEYPGTIERIARHLPHARFIYLVRHPLDRLESHYSQQVNNRLTSRSFVEELRQRRGLLLTSNYLWQTRQYLKYFPPDRMLVQFFEDFKTDPQRVFENCCRFLGVRADIKADESQTHLNPSSAHLEDRALFTLIRKLPGFRRFREWRHLVPQPIRDKLKRRLRRPIRKSLVAWDEPTLRWAIDQLALDTRQFLREHGKPEDFYLLTMDRLTKVASAPQPPDAQPSDE